MPTPHLVLHSDNPGALEQLDALLHQSGRKAREQPWTAELHKDAERSLLVIAFGPPELLDAADVSPAAPETAVDPAPALTPLEP